MMADRALVLTAHPGEISAEIAIPIPGERLPNTAEFASARAELVRAYEDAAGLAMADVERLGGDPDILRPDHAAHGNRARV